MRPSGIVSNVKTGEIVAMVSLPDFDPNSPKEANDPDRINRLTTGVYEMGSTFKAFTLAMALDSGKATLDSMWDARGNLHYGKFTIHDSHPLGRVINTREVFTYSSNIGAARIALNQGVEAHKAFLRKMGQLDRLRTELPESASPLVPKRWGELNTVTIAFGQGLSVAPLQAVMGINALMNGGLLIPPTFLKRSEEEARALAVRVVKPETSDKMRFLMRLNAEIGTAKKADVPGYYVGGKTGTSEKIFNGHYAKKRVLNSFTAILPADDPKYQILIMLDEPQARAGHLRLHHLGLERCSDRRQRHCPHRAACSASSRASICRRPSALFLRHRRKAGKRGASKLRVASLLQPVSDGTMKLRDLLGDDGATSPRGAGDLAVSGLASDSRLVKPGDVFFALAGAKTDGARFVASAIAAGAVAIVGEHAIRDRAANVPFVKAANARRALARAAARFFPRQPADDRRRHRHQRQDVGRRLHAANLGAAWPRCRERRHGRPGVAGAHDLRLADDARSDLAAPDARRDRARGRDASRVRGVVARPRPAPARRRARRPPVRSPICRATTWIIIRPSSITLRPSFACSAISSSMAAWP